MILLAKTNNQYYHSPKATNQQKLPTNQVYQPIVNTTKTTKQPRLPTLVNTTKPDY